MRAYRALERFAAGVRRRGPSRPRAAGACQRGDLPGQARREPRGARRSTRRSSTNRSISNGSTGSRTCFAPCSTVRTRCVGWVGRTRLSSCSGDLPSVWQSSQAVSLMQVASLEVARAKALTSLGRRQEAVIAYDQLVAMLDSEAALEYRQTTFWALSDKARLLRDLGDRNGRCRDTSRDLRALLGRSGSSAVPIGGLVGRPGGSRAREAAPTGRVRRTGAGDRRALRRGLGSLPPRSSEERTCGGRPGRRRALARSRGRAQARRARHRRRYGVTGSSRSVGPPPSTTSVSSGRPAPSPMYASRVPSRV